MKKLKLRCLKKGHLASKWQSQNSAPKLPYLISPIPVAYMLSHHRHLPSFCQDHDTVAQALEGYKGGKDWFSGAFLVAQWLRICLPVQGTRVQALVREDPTCRGTAKPVHHNYWACALEPASHNYWARVPQLLKPVRLEPVLCNKRSHRNEKPTHRNKE